MPGNIQSIAYDEKNNWTSSAIALSHVPEFITNRRLTLYQNLVIIQTHLADSHEMANN